MFIKEKGKKFVTTIVLSYIHRILHRYLGANNGVRLSNTCQLRGIVCHQDNVVFSFIKW